MSSQNAPIAQNILFSSPPSRCPIHKLSTHAHFLVRSRHILTLKRLYVSLECFFRGCPSSVERTKSEPSSVPSLWTTAIILTKISIYSVIRGPHDRRRNANFLMLPSVTEEKCLSPLSILLIHSNRWNLF